jgi:hypothetical protein
MHGPGKKMDRQKPLQEAQEDTFRNGNGHTPDFSRSFSSSYAALAKQRGGLNVMAVDNNSCKCLLRWLPYSSCDQKKAIFS